MAAKTEDSVKETETVRLVGPSPSSSVSVGDLDPSSAVALREYWQQLRDDLRSLAALEAARRGPQSAWNPYRSPRPSPTLKEDVRRSQVTEFGAWIPLDELQINGRAALPTAELAPVPSAHLGDHGVEPAGFHYHVPTPQDMATLRVEGVPAPRCNSGSCEIIVAEGVLQDVLETRRGAIEAAKAEEEERQAALQDRIDSVFAALWRALVVPFYLDEQTVLRRTRAASRTDLAGAGAGTKKKRLPSDRRDQIATAPTREIMRNAAVQHVSSMVVEPHDSHTGGRSAEEADNEPQVQFLLNRSGGGAPSAVTDPPAWLRFVPPSKPGAGLGFTSSGGSVSVSSTSSRTSVSLGQEERWRSSQLVSPRTSPRERHIVEFLTQHRGSADPPGPGQPDGGAAVPRISSIRLGTQLYPASGPPHRTPPSRFLAPMEVPPVSFAPDLTAPAIPEAITGLAPFVLSFMPHALYPLPLPLTQDERERRAPPSTTAPPPPLPLPTREIDPLLFPSPYSSNIPRNTNLTASRDTRWNGSASFRKRYSESTQAPVLSTSTLHDTTSDSSRLVVPAALRHGGDGVLGSPPVDNINASTTVPGSAASSPAGSPPPINSAPPPQGSRTPPQPTMINEDVALPFDDWLDDLSLSLANKKKPK